jgi:hypothetical protein
VDCAHALKSTEETPGPGGEPPPNCFQPADLGLHEAGHTYSSWLAAAGVPRERRDKYLGHADHTMDGRYTHQLDHQLLDDAKALGDYLRRADTPSRTGAHDWRAAPETAPLRGT